MPKRPQGEILSPFGDSRLWLGVLPWETAAGAAVLGVVGVVPLLGPLVTFAATCAGLGLIVLGLRDQFARPAYADPPMLTAPAAPPYQPGPTALTPYLQQDRSSPYPPQGPLPDHEVPGEP